MNTAFSLQFDDDLDNMDLSSLTFKNFLDERDIDIGPDYIERPPFIWEHASSVGLVEIDADRNLHAHFGSNIEVRMGIRIGDVNISHYINMHSAVVSGNMDRALKETQLMKEDPIKIDLDDSFSSHTSDNEYCIMEVLPDDIVLLNPSRGTLNRWAKVKKVVKPHVVITMDEAYPGYINHIMDMLPEDFMSIEFPDEKVKYYNGYNVKYSYLPNVVGFVPNPKYCSTISSYIVKKESSNITKFSLRGVDYKYIPGSIKYHVDELISAFRGLKRYNPNSKHMIYDVYGPIELQVNPSLIRPGGFSLCECKAEKCTHNYSETMDSILQSHCVPLTDCIYTTGKIHLRKRNGKVEQLVIDGEDKDLVYDDENITLYRQPKKKKKKKKDIKSVWHLCVHLGVKPYRKIDGVRIYCYDQKYGGKDCVLCPPKCSKKKYPYKHFHFRSPYDGYNDIFSKQFISDELDPGDENDIGSEIVKVNSCEISFPVKMGKSYYPSAMFCGKSYDMSLISTVYLAPDWDVDPEAGYNSQTQIVIDI